MRYSRLNIQTSSNKYSIYIGSNLSNKLKLIFNNEKIFFNKVLIIYDSKIRFKEISKIKINLKNKKVFIYKFISNEKSKSINTVNKVISKLLRNNFTRQDCIISLGGGITGDLSGFISSIYKRGIKFINIPTTLLAQVDASIGGKTGINHKIYGKNLIGSFYQPNVVISDTNYLKSLSKKELICGYAEIFKHSLIYNKQNFLFLEKFYKNILTLEKKFLEKAILESCKIKKSIVEKDEKEKNLRMILNLGHTFGHAYEAACGYKNSLNHGEGVMLGIKTAILFSLREKKLPLKDFNRINRNILNLNFNLKLKKFFKLTDISKLISFMKNDKKNNNSKINLILLNKIGKASIKNLYDAKKIKKFLLENLNNI